MTRLAKGSDWEDDKDGVLLGGVGWKLDGDEFKDVAGKECKDVAGKECKDVAGKECKDVAGKECKLLEWFIR